MLPTIIEPEDEDGKTGGPNPEPQAEDQVSPQAENDDVLPFTGSELGPFLSISVLLLAVGLILVLLGRRARAGR